MLDVPRAVKIASFSMWTPGLGGLSGFIKIPAEYPPACWRDESSSPQGEKKLLAK